MTKLVKSDTSRSERMLEIVRDLLRELDSPQVAERASLDSSFNRDLGLGSLERVELLVRVERAFDGRLADEVVQQADTPGQWLRALDSTMDGAAREQAARYPIVQPGAAPLLSSSPESFLDVLRERVDIDPDRVQVHLMDGDHGQDISYGQLLERSREVAAGLISLGLKPNETVAIMLPTSEEFFYAFWGTILAGGIAVPIYPPMQAAKIEEYVKRQVGILNNAGVRFLISFVRVQAVSQVMRLALSSVQEVLTVTELRRRGRAKPASSVDPSDIFFLQYTSGSTGNPKGVTLRHANVLANIQGIGWGVQVKPDDAVVSWLPLYHDMGLIGSWLFGLYYGLPITILSPLDFLSRPERWLWAVNDASRDVLCPAPNFSYELCARKVSDEAMEGVDLSRWRVVINAGEAVLPETLIRFEQRFRSYGFNAKGFIPCYGLAESSVALTFSPLWREPLIDTIDRSRFERDGLAEPVDEGENETSSISFVANGRPIPGHEIRVVDAQGCDVDERVRGRILFRGPSKTPGYYRNPEATAAVISEDGWMDTGDVGYLAANEIYITGRLKETIIKGGHNITPHEVELASAEVVGIRRGCVAAFGVTDHDTGTERLVVVAETRSGHAGEFDRIRDDVIRTVDERVGTPPDHVELVAPQTIPKTSSGKIRRGQAKILYEQGRLQVSHTSPWIQMARLWISHIGAYVRLLSTRFVLWSRDTMREVVVVTIGIVFGVLARLAPTRHFAAVMIRQGARLIASWIDMSNGAMEMARKDTSGSVLYIANRAGPYDAMTLVAMLPEVISLAENTGFEDLPIGVTFLLEPLVIADTGEVYSPPGETLEQRVLRVLLEEGSVLVLAENPTGREITRNRYRVEPLIAAAAANVQVVPVRLSPVAEHTPVTITLGDSLDPYGVDLESASRLREKIREIIAAL
jgi:acyl carrier protein